MGVNSIHGVLLSGQDAPSRDGPADHLCCLRSDSWLFTLAISSDHLSTPDGAHLHTVLCCRRLGCVVPG